ncbi:hypothetical protein [Legionella adelaidensis]|nr:hypothetical protein [Legionella adelaidensis]
MKKILSLILFSVLLSSCGFNSGCDACGSTMRNVTIIGCCSTTPW